jgi:hypothetical protein
LLSATLWAAFRHLALRRQREMNMNQAKLAQETFTTL